MSKSYNTYPCWLARSSCIVHTVSRTSRAVRVSRVHTHPPCSVRSLSSLRSLCSSSLIWRHADSTPAVSAPPADIKTLQHVYRLSHQVKVAVKNVSKISKMSNNQQKKQQVSALGCDVEEVFVEPPSIQAAWNTNIIRTRT